MRKRRVGMFIAIMAIAIFLSGAHGMRVNAMGTIDEQREEISAEYQEELEVEYLYVEKSYVGASERQNIVVALKDESVKVDLPVLEYMSEDGSIAEMECKDKQDGLYLFSEVFESENKGLYEVSKFKYSIAGIENELVLNDVGIEAHFGVDTDVQGTRSSNVITIENESEMTDATGTVEVNQEEKSIAADVSEALSEVEAEIPETVREGELGRAEDLVIVLDPGHDSKHAGTSASGVKEEVVSLKIAQYCKAVLEQYSGVRVYMTREGAGCPFPNTATNITDIKERADWAKTKGADVFISFHINSSEASNAHGAEVYYPKGNTDAQDLAQEILKDLVNLGLKNRGDKGNEGYAVIKYSKENGFPGLIIEHAFVSNSSDVKWFQSEDNLKKLGEADAQGIIRHYNLKKGSWEYIGGKWKWKDANGNYVVNSWKYIDSKWYFFDDSGYMLTGWQYIYGQTYYLNPSGDMVTGWRYIDGICYYFNGSGHLLKGEQTIDGAKWYLDKETGAWEHGWQYVSGKWYYHNYNGYMQTGWQRVDGIWYYMDSSGVMQTGWQYINGAWYYMNKSGQMQTGWQTIDGQTYYLTSNGDMVTGWRYVEGICYYFSASGHLLKGEQTIDGVKWNLDKETGAWRHGWQRVDGKWYYHNYNGYMQTGWQTIDGQMYYFIASGDMVTGWRYVEGICYYFNTSGHLLKGEQTIDGAKWNLDKGTGAWKHGWQYVSGKWYYHNYNGYMQTSWQRVDGIWYYMNSSGVMQTGWQYINGAWYYMNKSGQMQTGWQTIDGQTYYLVTSGEMVTGWRYIDGICYYFNASGYLLKGEQTIDGAKWYLDKETGAWKHGWQYVKGKWYYHNYNGYMQTGWQYIDGAWYYMNSKGIMQTGWIQVDGMWYYMESSGVWNPSPSGKPPVNEDVSTYYSIVGESSVTVEQMVKYFKSKGVKYDQVAKNPGALKRGGASTIEEFCQIYYEECATEGIRAEVAFAQMLHETGNLQFTGDVQVGQYNFAGLGATGDGEQGASFKDVRTGIRAHVQHLKCYANTEPLKNECVDPRWGEWLRGKAPYVEWLSIENNPNKVGWATDKEYAVKLRKLINQLIAV